jgi:hypothetical protein
MTSRKRRLAPSLALILLAGCESNPDGPRVAPHATPGPSADGPPARRPITKNPRELTNPD